MVGDFRLLWRLLSPRAQKGLLWVIGMLVFSAALELGAVGLITRFMGGVLGATSVTSTVTLLPGTNVPAWQAALLTMGAFGASNFVLGFSSWRVGRFIWEQEVDISCRAFEAVLRMPYGRFLSRNSGTLHQQIWCEQLCRGFLAPGLIILSRTLSCTFLFLGVVFADWRAAAIATITVVFIYAAIHSILTGPVARMGQEHRASQGERQRLTTEMLNSYKSIKLMQRWQGLLTLYGRAARRAASRAGVQELVVELPRYVLETTALAGLVGMVLYLLYMRENRIFAMISLYGIAGYRILPSVHSIFRLGSTMAFNRSSVQVTFDLLREGGPLPETPSPALEHELCIENARLHFPSRTRPALDGVSLRIGRGQMVGLAGMTGSGKSTLLDVCSGLLVLDEGRITIDGEPLLPEGVVDWQRRLGFLPQSVETLDDTIAANICFGLEADPLRLQQVVREAALEDFLLELPEGLETRVGERASFLSSGQRQRLGLARALYHNPSFLLLDEASSSLDGKTEESLLATLSSYKGEKTMLMAAHRPSALAICDWIYFLEAGQVVAQGHYSDLVANSVAFQQLLALERESVKSGGDVSVPVPNPEEYRETSPLPRGNHRPR